MKTIFRVAWICLVFVATGSQLLSQNQYGEDNKLLWALPYKNSSDYSRKPKYPDWSELSGTDNISRRLSNYVMPVLACWFWSENEFRDNGYKSFLDTMGIHSPYNILAASIRLRNREITMDAVHDQIKKAAEYATTRGLNLVADLDVRCARQAFKEKYPNELQKMLKLKEVDLSKETSVTTVVRSKDLSDHYTGRTTHYIPLSGLLLRVYAYNRASAGIASGSLMDITEACITAHASKDSVVIKIPIHNLGDRDRACVMVSFTHFTPAVFAPHLMAFQREIIQQYADTKLIGTFKDEWGFPPSWNEKKDEFWYSKFRAQVYAENTGGRELLKDCLLMYLGINGLERERQMAINHFMEMSWQRNGALEDDFYRSTKEVFGPLAVVETHPTWWPYPGWHEYKKNGLDWWVTTRDWAQTDETTPFAVRTSLSKKWNSPVWYNMYYSTEMENYKEEMWSSALAAGRINYHPFYPSKIKRNRHIELLRGNLMQGESRIRLLNYISKSPLDCPVAVIFGHARTMNWAGPRYDDVGMELVNELWQKGIMTDLIPSSEIENKNLHIDKNGWICYGPQRYTAVILYYPEFERPFLAKFFKEAEKGHTRMFRVGEWTKNFNAEPFEGNKALPGSMTVRDDISILVPEIRKLLAQQGIPLQTPATRTISFGKRTSFAPPTTGFCRLTDGTFIYVAGTKNPTGDRIKSTFKVNGFDVRFDATGVAAARLNDAGEVQALAAGGLKFFKTGNFKISLPEPLDMALWKDRDENWYGVVQGWSGDIPASLQKITKQWERLGLPVPLKEIKGAVPKE